ncbi:AAA family ATPase [Thermopolyspora sp. NPDC052614]|uniref:AAA family ATPase n=1 Tax=Thermopolyspora sp. NPDC052614 TaxID=3155682 RepID=UPI00342B5D92
MGQVDRAAVIADEQREVDHICDCVEQDRRSIDAVRVKLRSDCPDAGLAPVPDVPVEFGDREDLGGRSLVTTRVDLTDDPDGRLTWYLGRRSVRDRDGDLVLVKWTSRQATRWRLATPDAPDDVWRLRTLRCEGPKVLDYSDQVIRPEAAPASAAPRADTATGTATATETGTGTDRPEDIDPFLLAELDSARDGSMRDIVETIRRDQLLLVSDERKGLLIVQGGPGTGKTAIGLHRVTWLLDNRHFTADEVLVVGPHRAFLQYVKDVLPRLGSRGVATVEISQLWDGEVRGADTPQTRLVKSDERMAAVLRNAVENWIRPDRITADLEFSFRGAHLTIGRAELAGLAREARDSAGPYLVRRRRFVDRTLDLLIQRYQEATRLKKADDKFRSQAEKQPRLAALLNAVWPTLTAERVLRHLLNAAEAVREASFGVLTGEEQLALVRPQARRTADEPWTPEDLVCLEELRFLLSGDEPQRYRHIVADEAQDLTPMQARSLARRCPSGSMTVLGDLAQSVGGRQYDVWGRLAGILAGADGWHIAELAVGYRVPREVMAFARPLATALSPSTAFPESIRPPAPGSLTVTSVRRAKLVGETVSRALGLAMRSEEEVRSVAIITPDDGELLREIDREVAKAQEATLTGLSRPISVLPAPLAKGLEFDHVIVVEPQRLADQGPVGLRRLYVAITRCTQSLTVLHSAPLPAELGGPADAARKAPKGGPAAEPAVATDAVPYESREHLLAALRERISAARAQDDHGYLRHVLAADLYKNGLRPSTDSEFADVIRTTPRGSAIYVVSGTALGTYPELRAAAVRALEVEWAGGERADEVFLVLPEEPREMWAVDVIGETLKVSLMWRTPAGWGGPHVDLALGRTPDADESAAD